MYNKEMDLSWIPDESKYLPTYPGPLMHGYRYQSKTD
jgi:hypothetical protein